MNYNDIEKARIEAQHQINLADRSVRDAVSMSAGRLRISGVSGYVLKELKKELKNFNAATCEWKD